MPKKGKKTTIYAKIVFSGRDAGISAGLPELDEKPNRTWPLYARTLFRINSF
jgi:hypothetical protein